MEQENQNPDKAVGNPKAASVRIGSNTMSSFSTQRRHDLRIGPQPGYVDGERSYLNRTLIQYPGPAAMRQIARDRRAVRDTKRAVKSNAAIATAGVISFGAEAAQMFEELMPDQQDAALLELAEAVAERLDTSLHGLVVHLDEATLHAHFTLSAYDRAGRPLSKSTRPAVMSELQDLTAEVMARHCPGIERGHRYGDRLEAGADFADVVHRSVRELHRDLPRDLEAARARIAAAEKAQSEASARVDEMQARVAKLEARSKSLTEKEWKRLATYSKRHQNRQNELDAAKAEVEAANAAAERIRAEADRMAELARADAKAATEDAEAARDEAEAMRVQADDQRREIAADRATLDLDRAELDAERSIVAALRERLTRMIRKVERWLERPDLSAPAAAAAQSIVDDGVELLQSPPEEPPEDSPGGPGF